MKFKINQFIKLIANSKYNQLCPQQLMIHKTKIKLQKSKKIKLVNYGKHFKK